MSQTRRSPMTGGLVVTRRWARAAISRRAGPEGGRGKRGRLDCQCAADSRGHAERIAAAAAAEQSALEQERRSRQQSAELERLKTEFISSISHELRTPLTSISGYLEMLMDGGAGTLSTPQGQMLTVIERNSRRLLALLDDLLTLSRLEAGVLSVGTDAVDVRELVDQVVSASRSQFTARSLTLTTDVENSLGLIPGDAAELRRALEHVLDNAAKFTLPGGRILLSARCAQETVTVAVADTGVGISVTDSERLFTRFFRSDSSYLQAVPGTGLGLVIVKGIVAAHQGEVQVESTLGVGTTVTISLPRPRCA